MTFLQQNTLANQWKLQLGQQQVYPMLSYQYDVILGGVLTSFSKISGMVLKSAEVTAVNEGGRNQPYLFRDSRKNIHTMTLEKGYGTLDLLELSNKVIDVTILLRKQDLSIVQAYATSYAVVQEIKLSDLEASDTKVLIQSMTVAYTILSPAKNVLESCRKLERENAISHENVSPKIAAEQNKRDTKQTENINQQKIQNKNETLNIVKKQNQRAMQKQRQENEYHAIKNMRQQKEIASKVEL